MLNPENHELVRAGLRFENWGLISYGKAQKMQLDWVKRVQEDISKEKFFFCSHEPVVTLGRASQKTDLCGWDGPIFDVQRGGRATYHGPGQVVVYPILDLNSRGRDIHKYIRSLEKGVIKVLDEYGLKAQGNVEDATGVWVNGKKIASIGIGVKRWVTFHGLAFNLESDPLSFQGISPCGFQANVMTSLEEQLDVKVERSVFEGKLLKSLTYHLD